MPEDVVQSGKKESACCKSLMKLSEDFLVEVKLDNHTYPMLRDDAHHLLHTFTETECKN